MAALQRITISTPIGELTVFVSQAGVVETLFGHDDEPDAVTDRLERSVGPVRSSTRGLSGLAREVDGYFAGRLRRLATRPDLSPIPPGFARRVLEVASTIPYGELWTYGDVAGMAGSPRGGRAAGAALGRCPVELFVPCHRVVHAGGTIGGYGRHEERKRWLIHHEAAT